MPPVSSMLIGLLPLASTLTPFLLAGGVWYLRTQFASKADFDALSLKVINLTAAVQTAQGSIDHLTEEQDSTPTRIELLNEIAGLKGRVSGMEAGLHGIEARLATTNDYLQILVQRGIDR